MKLPKTAPGVTRGMSALSGYTGQAGVEPSWSSCRWAGTAPFCAGQCLPGETEVARTGQARTPAILRHSGRSAFPGPRPTAVSKPDVDRKGRRLEMPILPKVLRPPFLMAQVAKLPGSSQLG